jgi:threonine dehydrogenase-like Zn-dependent dehydrogenase
MKILQVTAPGEFRIIEQPVADPGPGEALVRIDAVTTCPQWDLHLQHNDPMFVGHQFHYPYTPGQPGHEATGEVVAVGAGVEELKVGDCVSAWRDRGHRRTGCYAQFVVSAAADFIRVPGDLSPEARAPVELAMCVGSAFLMLEEMDAIAGRCFGVNGLGPAGLIALQMARAEGAARIVGFDPSESRRKRALDLGIDAVYDPNVELPGEIGVRPGGPTLQTAIDCVGSKRAVEFLMDRTADALALFGVLREDLTFAPRHWAGLRLCGYQGHSRRAADYAVGLMALDLLNLAPLVTHTLPLEAYGEAIGLLERQEAIKVCFSPWVDV